MQFKTWYEVDIVEQLSSNIWRNHFCAAKFTSLKAADEFINKSQENLGEGYRLKIVKISIEK